MVVASFVVSVLALLVAGAAVVFTWSQARETRRLRELESARRHEELRPEVDVVLEEVPSAGQAAWHRLTLTNVSGRSVTGARVTLIDAPGSSFTANQYGVEAGKFPILDAVLPEQNAPLRPGEQYSWRMEFDTSRTTGALRLRLDIEGHDDAGAPAAWTSTRQLTTPVDPGQTIW